jgi:CheY-like chemotaxis protein
MAPEVAAQVFRPYFTTKGAAGTGLGLSVVATIVRAQGGAVTLTTAPGAGTRFRVLWPAEAEAEAAAGLGAGEGAAATAARAAPVPASVPPSAAPSAAAGALAGRAILVVDDSADVLDINARYLEQAGAEVAPTSDPAEALEAVRDDPAAWAAVVTDYDMPGMTGADLARQVAALAPGLPVVLVTALPGWDRRPQAEAGLFAAVLGKPATRDSLVSAVAAALR